MNKQELEITQEIIDGSKSLIEKCKTSIEFYESIKSRAQAQLAEAEKPELGHGDFGIEKNGDPRVMMNDWSDRLSSVGAASYAQKAEYGREAVPNVVFGNIFDLMKDWGKGFKNWVSKPAYKGAISIIIEVNESGIFFGNELNGATFEPENIYEIWCELGHAIIELKRKKQGKDVK